LGVDLVQNLQRTFHQFVEIITSRPGETQLRAAMEDVIGAFDLRSFAYLIVTPPRNGERVLISNYPTSWTDFYLENRYQALDPVILRASEHPEPFMWGPGFVASQSPAATARFFDEAAQFGLCHGLTIPIHGDQNGVAAVTFAADHHLAAFERCLDGHLPLLQLVATFFHRYARHALRSDRVICGATLSPRELECLTWAAQGKSAWEIGQILGISRRTSAFHLDNVRAKLGVGTVKQAIARFSADRETVF